MQAWVAPLYPLYHVGAFYQFTLTKASVVSGCTPGKQYSGTIKYDTLSPDLGPFSIVSNVGLVSPPTATRAQLLSGLTIKFDCTATTIEIKSTGVCDESDILQIPDPPPDVQKVQKEIVSEIVELNNESEILLDANNIGFPLNSVSLDLPKGMYKIRIIDNNTYINGKYRSLLRILTTKGMSIRSMDFIDKGSFDLLEESKLAYNNSTIIVDHDGGLLKAYLLGEQHVDNTGIVVLGVTPLRLTLNPNQLSSLKPLIKNNIVRVKNINVDISMDGVNTGIQTSFEFNGTILVPTKNI